MSLKSEFSPVISRAWQASLGIHMWAQIFLISDFIGVSSIQGTEFTHCIYSEPEKSLTWAGAADDPAADQALLWRGVLVLLDRHGCFHHRCNVHVPPSQCAEWLLRSQCSQVTPSPGRLIVPVSLSSGYPLIHPSCQNGKDIWIFIFQNFPAGQAGNNYLFAFLIFSTKQ